LKVQDKTPRFLAFLRFLAELWRIGLCASLALRGAFALRVAFMAANNLIYFVFWGLLFARVPDVRGYALPEMATLYGVLCCGVGLSVTLWGGVHQLARMIEDGELDVILAQPKPVLPYALGMRCQAAGSGICCRACA
jgi:ABC-2 type transport system permease protein